MDPNKLSALHKEKVGGLEECTVFQRRKNNNTTTRFIGRLMEGVQELKPEQQHLFCFVHASLQRILKPHFFVLFFSFLMMLLFVSADLKVQVIFSGHLQVHSFWFCELELSLSWF